MANNNGGTQIIKMETVKTSVKATRVASERVVVVGTGCYGLAIGKRLLQHGYSVTFASRNPNLKYVNEYLEQTASSSASSSSFDVATSPHDVKEIGEALRQAVLSETEQTSTFVFLAIRASRDVYESFVDELALCFGKKQTASSPSSSIILVELSNLDSSSSSTLLEENESGDTASNAERLQAMISARLAPPECARVRLVKAFNTLSAHAMSNTDVIGMDALAVVPMASDCPLAKERLARLCARIGFVARDSGPLARGRELELANASAFAEWRYPSLITLLFVLFNSAWSFVNYFVFPKKPHTFEQYLRDFSVLANLNKVLGFSALQLLAFVYMASVVAAVYQLAWGTTQRRFPRLLDAWLRTRKQFGLYAFLIATMHVVCSLLVASPAYLANWYRNGGASPSDKFSLHGEINMLTGLVAYVLMALVALSSLRTVATSLNWREWQFVQTGLGLACLAVSLAHDVAMYLNILFDKEKFNYDLVYLMTRIKLTASYFPFAVLVMRALIAYCAPIRNRLAQIRQGRRTLAVKSR